MAKSITYVGLDVHKPGERIKTDRRDAINLAKLAPRR